MANTAKERSDILSMRRLFFKGVFLFAIVFVGIYIFGYVSPQNFSQACAAKFGPQCGEGGNRACPANPNFDPLVTYGTACVDSINLHGTVRVYGLTAAGGNISAAANVRGFELDDNYTCNDVKCLKREDQSTPVNVMPGGGSGGVTYDSADGALKFDYTIDTIGCSSDGNCTDWFSLTAVVLNSGNYAECHRIMDGTLVLKGLNGTSPSLPDVGIQCTPKSTPVCNSYCDSTIPTCPGTNGKVYQPMTTKCTVDGQDTYTSTCVPLNAACEITQPTPTPTKTPTPSPTKTPTPTPTGTLTPTPTKTPTPSPTPPPSVCPVPSAVTNIRISCPDCGL